MVSKIGAGVIGTITLLVTLLVIISFTLFWMLGSEEKVQASVLDESSMKTIKVTGDSVISSEPDQATFVVGVRTVSEDAERASRENAEKMSAIKEALMGEGIDEDDLSTSGYRVMTRTRRTDDVIRIIGYEVSNSLNVKTDDIESVGKYIDIAVNRGANNVSSINFGIKNSDELKYKALKLATEQAYTKAKYIAEGFNGTIKEVIHVSEGRSAYTPIRMDSFEMMMDSESASPTTLIEAGDVEISARIEMIVRF